MAGGKARVCFNSYPPAFSRHIVQVACDQTLCTYAVCGMCLLSRCLYIIFCCLCYKAKTVTQLHAGHC